jgi:hypothetical protein
MPVPQDLHGKPGDSEDSRLYGRLRHEETLSTGYHQTGNARNLAICQSNGQMILRLRLVSHASVLRMIVRTKRPGRMMAHSIMFGNTS